jgi:hypothetical protein
MSINNITFLEEVIPHNMFCFSNNLTTWFYFNDIWEISEFLSELEYEQAYVVSFDFYFSSLLCCEETPAITLSKPILVTNKSNPELISNYLKERVIIACESFHLQETSSDNNMDGPVVVVNYSKINLF